MRRPVAEVDPADECAHIVDRVSVAVCADPITIDEERLVAAPLARVHVADPVEPHHDTEDRVRHVASSHTHGQHDQHREQRQPERRVARYEGLDMLRGALAHRVQEEDVGDDV